MILLLSEKKNARINQKLIEATDLLKKNRANKRNEKKIDFQQNQMKKISIIIKVIQKQNVKKKKS